MLADKDGRISCVHSGEFLCKDLGGLSLGIWIAGQRKTTAFPQEVQVDGIEDDA